MDFRLDKDKAELGVRVLAVALEVLAHGDSLLDEAVKVLGDLRCEAVLLQQTQDLGASHPLDLRDSILVTQDNTNLRW